MPGCIVQVDPPPSNNDYKTVRETVRDNGAYTEFLLHVYFTAMTGYEVHLKYVTLQLKVQDLHSHIPAHGNV